MRGRGRGCKGALEVAADEVGGTERAANALQDARRALTLDSSADPASEHHVADGGNGDGVSQRQGQQRGEHALVRGTAGLIDEEGGRPGGARLILAALEI